MNTLYENFFDRSLSINQSKETFIIAATSVNTVSK